MQDASNIEQKFLLEQALEIAFKEGNTSALSQLIQNGIDVNIRLDDDKTSLMEAVRAGDIDAVRILIEAGADVNALDNGGSSALWKAANFGLQNIFDYLAPLTNQELRQEAEDMLPSGLVYRQRADDYLTEDFIGAASMGDSDAVLAAIVSGVNIDAIGGDQTPALVPAAYWGHVDVVKLLLEYGADANCKTEDDQKTPLIEAASGTSLAKNARFTGLTTDENHITVIRLLLHAGADVNAKTLSGWNALMAAANAGSIKAVQLLVEGGAVLNAKDNRGDTALSRAKQAGHQEIVQFLQHAGAEEEC